MTALAVEHDWNSRICDAQEKIKALLPAGKWPVEWKELEKVEGEHETLTLTAAFICGMLAANPGALVLGNIDSKTLSILQGRKPQVG